MELISESSGGQLQSVLTHRVCGDEMTVNGTSGGTLHTGCLAAHNNLGGRLAPAPPPASLLHRQRAGAGARQLRDEETCGGAGGDYYGRLLQERHWGAGGGGGEERTEVTVLWLLLFDGQPRLRLDLEERGGGCGGWRARLGRHWLYFNLARVDNQTGREICVHF